MADTKFILVVEDDPVLKNLLGHTFAGKYQTLYANDGNEAIALFEQYRPALVLLDLMLPTMDGFAVLESIRTRPDESAKTPVIIVSNLGQESDKQRATQLGATSYLVKADVDVDEIVAKMEAILNGGVTALAASAAAAPQAPTVQPAAPTAPTATPAPTPAPTAPAMPPAMSAPAAPQAPQTPPGAPPVVPPGVPPVQQ